MGGETSIYLDPRGVLGTRSSEQEVVLGFWTAVKARGDTGAFMGQLPESSASLALLSLPGKADDLRFLQLTPVSILSVSSEPSSRGHRAVTRCPLYTPLPGRGQEGATSSSSSQEGDRHLEFTSRFIYSGWGESWKMIKLIKSLSVCNYF